MAAIVEERYKEWDKEKERTTSCADVVDEGNWDPSSLLGAEEETSCLYGV